MLYWARKRDLTRLVAENEEVCEFKSEKTLSMVLVFWFGHISAACEPNHMTQGTIL